MFLLCFQVTLLILKLGKMAFITCFRYLKAALSEDPLPETFDWRDHNMVSSVKDQGSAGTCWAFR